MDANPGMVALLKDAIKTLESKGATVIEIELNKELKDIGKNEFPVLII
jgi:amidase